MKLKLKTYIILLTSFSVGTTLFSTAIPFFLDTDKAQRLQLNIDIMSAIFAVLVLFSVLLSIFRPLNQMMNASRILLPAIRRSISPISNVATKWAIWLVPCRYSRKMP